MVGICNSARDGSSDVRIAWMLQGPAHLENAAVEVLNTCSIACGFGEKELFKSSLGGEKSRCRQVQKKDHMKVWGERVFLKSVLAPWTKYSLGTRETSVT